MMSRPQGAIKRALTVTLVTLLVTACTGNGESSESSSELVSVTTTTNFLTFGRDAYVYVAKEMGYFAEVGLDVNIEQGSGTTGNLSLLLSGDVQFTPVDLAGLVIAVRNPDPTATPIDGVVAFAAIHQLPLGAVMTDDPNITSPLDLRGKKVGAPIGAVTYQLFPVWAGLHDVRAELVGMQGTELISSLSSGTVDAIGQFVPGKGTVEAALGRDVTVFPYSDVLDDMLGVVYTTTVDIAENDPDLVIRFRDAVLRGLEYALDHPEEAGQILQQYEPDAVEDPEVAAEELRAMRFYCTANAVTLGEMAEARVMRTIATLDGANAIDAKGLTPEDVVDFSLVPGGGQ